MSCRKNARPYWMISFPIGADRELGSQFHMEQYRSGHNEADSKSVSPSGPVGSNPTCSARSKAPAGVLFYISQRGREKNKKGRRFYRRTAKAAVWHSIHMRVSFPYAAPYINFTPLRHLPSKGSRVFIKNFLPHRYHSAWQVKNLHAGKERFMYR